MVRGTSLFAGIGQGRITNNLATIVKDIDGALQIADEKSIAMVYEMLDTEGIYIGASSALNVVAAYEMAQKLGPGKSLLLFEVKIWIRCPKTGRKSRFRGRVCGILDIQ